MFFGYYYENLPCIVNPKCLCIIDEIIYIGRDKFRI